MRIVVTSLLVAIALGSPAAMQDGGDVLRIWKVGSPFEDRIPRTAVPGYLSDAAARAGLRVVVEAFPGRAFPAAWAEATARGALPDLLVVNHSGQIAGAVLPKGRIAGVAEDPDARRHFIRLDGIYHELISVGGGVVYLHDASPRHGVLRASILEPRTCAGLTAADGETTARAVTLATAYLAQNDEVLQAASDPDRLVTARPRPGSVDVITAHACLSWSIPRLALVQVATTFAAETAIGHAQVLVVLRRRGADWMLLAAARDTISNVSFVRQAIGTLSTDPLAVAPLRPDAPGAGEPLLAATLTAPADGRFPFPPFLQESGAFEWTSSPSPEVVAEVVEFAGRDDARLVLARRGLLDLTGSLSAREAPWTNDDWRWRVWSLTADGDVVFSETRTFHH
jgi:hypothetical protein